MQTRHSIINKMCFMKTDIFFGHSKLECVTIIIHAEEVKGQANKQKKKCFQIIEPLMKGPRKKANPLNS